MFDALINDTFNQDKTENPNATLTIGNTAEVHDGESILILFSKGAFRSAVTVNNQTQISPSISTEELLQSYLDNGGIAWICKACTKTNKWHIQAVKTKAQPTCWGIEYIAQDIAKLIQRHLKEKAESMNVAGAIMSACVLDPYGNALGTLNKPDCEFISITHRHKAWSQSIAIAA